jgi:hypothetical protein
MLKHGLVPWLSSFAPLRMTALLGNLFRERSVGLGRTGFEGANE